MASLYNLEPQPTAKVILNTTSGDLTLELFGKQTPLATRNFLQHCLDGYYNNTIFHRLVPGFIIQGGDPTGSGSGGISAINNGDPFQDEFHSRLKFNRRGLLGMANEGKDSNASQFFLTLGVTPELQGKHTMFGRIEGDTIFNLMKMADAEFGEEGSERPLYPTRITGAEVLLNPFEDLVARVKEAPRSKIDDSTKKDAKKRKKAAGKNVLSFGEEDGEDGIIAPVAKKTKANPKMVSSGLEDSEKLKNTRTPESPATKSAPVAANSPPRPSVPTKVASKVPQRAAVAAPVRGDSIGEDSEDEDEAEDTATAHSRARQSALDKANAEIAALKASMKRTTGAAPQQKEKPKSALEAMIPETSTRGRKRGKATDEKGTLDLFNAFKQRLEDLPSTGRDADENGAKQNNDPTGQERDVPPTTDEPDEEAELCDLHFIANCQSCRAWDDEKPGHEAEADGDDDPGWLAHRLTFARDTLGKDLEWKRKMEEIEVIDPREKARAIQKEGRKGKSDRRK